MSRILICLVGGCLLNAASSAVARTECPNGATPVAEIVSVQGTLTDLSLRLALTVGDVLCPGPIALATGPQSRGALRIFATGIKIRLAENTELRMGDAMSPAVPATVRAGGEESALYKSIIEMVRGAIHVFTRAPYKLDVYTEYVTAGVEGTEFLVEANTREKALYVNVFEGSVRMTYAPDPAQSILLTSEVDDQSAGYAQGSAPPQFARKAKIKTRGQVEWALFYPPLGTDAIGAASDLLDAGQPAAATSALAAAAESPEKLALETIIRVAEGQSAAVLTDTARLVATPLTKLALSYAYQGALKLDDALATLESIDPKDRLIWARISELRLAQGDRHGAADAAVQAGSGFDVTECAASEPGKSLDYIARAVTVAGFAQLANMQAAQASKTFECAITLASQDPLPRFGLGLAQIRQGDLASGAHNIEIAVLLDPTNALFRSYLGKAFFEAIRQPSLFAALQGRSGAAADLAAQQFELAKALDPNDPTPWFYDALKKQSENRPVEALRDLETSIDKNDNRAVYRSKFMLDQDLAARSAGLARVYADLGFSQLALAEGWKSVNHDPGNYSAHRFLADTYSALPRHEIARVSELLQSQLRQPLNATPIQPQLGQADLLILEGAGPSSLSFNEFNPVFARNGMTFQGNGIVGGNSTFGTDFTASVLGDRAAFTIGYFDYQTDGFRANNDIDQRIVNAFFQFNPLPGTSIQLEARNRELEQGDLSLFFDQSLFSILQRETEDTDVYRLGLRQEISNRQDVLLNITTSISEPQLGVPNTIAIDLDNHSRQAEVQHLWEAQYTTIVSGAGYIDVSSRDAFSFLLPIPVFIPPSPVPIFVIPPPIVSESNTRHANLYSYWTTPLFDALNLTLGVSADRFDGTPKERNRINPKLGITWLLTDQTILRAAAFRTVNRTLIGAKTLEPTQLAGFNQLFDDGAATLAKRYGVGLDHKFSKAWFCGAEYSRRKLLTPSINALGPDISILEEQSREKLGRAYVYWTPHERLALRSEIQVENFSVNISEVALGRFRNLDTARLLLGANYTARTGLIADFAAKLIDQDGTFADGSQRLIAGADRFVDVDMSITWRLPNRFGKISILVKNLFDQEFQFQDTDSRNPSLAPERLVLLQANLVLK